MNNPLAWGFPCFGSSPQDGDASLARQEMPSTPCENQGRIGQSAWQERGPVVSRIQRQHDRHFQPFLPIAVRHDVLRDNNFAVSLRNSADILCRRTAAQRLHDANIASRQAGKRDTTGRPRWRDLGKCRWSRRNAHDRQTFYSATHCGENKNKESEKICSLDGNSRKIKVREYLVIQFCVGHNHVSN